MAENQDLLQPTLSTDDDAVGFDRPWDPGTLWWLTLITGALGGAVLLAQNERRLGIRGRGAWILLAFFALAFAYMLALRVWFTGIDAEQRRVARYGMNVASVALASVFVGRQRRRFRIFESAGGSASPLLWPGVLAFLGNLLAMFALFLLVEWIVPGSPPRSAR